MLHSKLQWEDVGDFLDFHKKRLTKDAIVHLFADFKVKIDGDQA